MTWDLPESLEVNGEKYFINTDYRCALEIMTDLADPEADDQDRAAALLIGLYKDFDAMPPEDYDAAIKEGLWFLRGGEDDASQKPGPRVVDFEQDYSLIIGPVNKVLGTEIRALEHVHFWTFLAAYGEIGDCTFAQVVKIRDHLARGKPLDKSDRAWYQKNRHLVDFKRKYTEADNDILKAWGI